MIAFLRRIACNTSNLIFLQQTRLTRGKPVEIARSLEERLAELNKKDPVLDAAIDIGFPYLVHPSCSPVRKERTEIKKQIKNDAKLAAEARHGTLLIDLDKVREDSKGSVERISIQTSAEHYGIFDSLFQHGYFTPLVVMDIMYDYDEESVTPVCKGNIISPSDAKKAPHVIYEASPDSLWTLILTCPDEHFIDNEAEYIHWFIGNIKGSDISSGDLIFDYLQPFPPKGSGHHRYVFVLYKQECLIDYSAFQKKLPNTSLSERTFKTFDFYKEHQDVLTPAGLAFFQSTWDESLTDFFHNVLCMREPRYEYDFPAQYFKPQVKFPEREPFNLYLDRYRDPKDIKKEVLLKRLKMIHPFEEEPPYPKYPLIFPLPKDMPSWLKVQYNKERGRVGKYRDLRPYTSYPQEEPKKFVRYNPDPFYRYRKVFK